MQKGEEGATRKSPERQKGKTDEIFFAPPPKGEVTENLVGHDATNAILNLDAVVVMQDVQVRGIRFTNDERGQKIHLDDPASVASEVARSGAQRRG
eukprot:734076-Amphidinium_carterae.1